MRKTLVLFSCGKDSFLTACREAVKQQYVILMSFNSGTVIGEEAFGYGANRLIRMYGSDKVSFAGVYPTAATIARLNHDWIQRDYSALTQKYPTMTNCQFNCLHCQTAMWIAALAYAKAKLINRVVCGYKASDEFCTGLQEYCDDIIKLAVSLKIEVDFPMWDFGDDWERDLEMGMYGFEPQVAEPKCLMGQAPCICLKDVQKDDLLKYFRQELLPKMPELIEHLVPIFRYIRLSDKSFTTWEKEPDFADSCIRLA